MIIKPADLERFLEVAKTTIYEIGQRFRSGHFRTQVFEHGFEDRLIQAMDGSTRRLTEYEFKQKMIMELVPLVQCDYNTAEETVAHAEKLADLAYEAVMKYL